MKKINFLLVCFITFLISLCLNSCSKNDDDINDSSNPIVGAWLCNETGSGKNYYIFTNSGILYGLYMEEGEKLCLKIHYTYKNGVLNYYGSGIDDTYNVKIKDNKMYLYDEYGDLYEEYIKTSSPYSISELEKMCVSF